MLFHIRKRISVTGCDSRIINIGSAVATQRRCRLRASCRRAINLNISQSTVYRAIRIAHHFHSDRVGKVFDTKKKKSTTIESVASEFDQRIEHTIPDPTWSLQELDLTSSHSSISRQELERLSKLVLVDMTENCNNGDEETLNLMKQDLGNMLHMIQHVTKYDYQESSGNCKHDSTCEDLDNMKDPIDDPTKNSRTYDTVRGLRGMPLRKGIDLDPLQAQDDAQAQDILKNTLYSRTIDRGGSHKYFAIKTTKL